MNRYTLLLLLGVLGLGLLFFIKSAGEKSKTEQIKEKMSFHVEDIDDVYKIFIGYRGQPAVTLTRDRKKWILDGEHEVNPYIMEGILDVIENARVQYIPSITEVDAAMPIMATQGIKIEVYNKKDEELMSYYIGSVTQNEKGTFFYKEGGEQSYVMELPYGESSIRQRFSIQYDDWKTRLIYDDRVEQIRSVKVEYPRSPGHGFIIRNKSGEFSITPADADQPNIRRDLKRNVFEKYLMGYKGVNFVEFNNQVTAKDSILNNTPFMIQEVVNTKGDTFSLKLWPKTRQIATPRQAHDIENPLNGYYALDRNGNFGTIQHIVLRGTIAGYEHFYE